MKSGSNRQKAKMTKEQEVVDGSFSFLNGYECVSVCCKFMLLKKLVVLHLCDLIHKNGQANSLFVVFMIFGDGEAQQDALVLEFKEGAHDGGNKRDTLLKS
jgi:hypothetical protein